MHAVLSLPPQVDEYIKTASPMEVNISDRTRRSVLKAVKTGSDVATNALKPAQKEVSSALKDGIWADFIASIAEQATLPRTPSSPSRKRVVIVGGGFCGTFAAMQLDMDPRFEVVLVDTKDYFEYTPSILKAFNNPGAHARIVHPHAETVQNGRVIVGEVRACRDDCVAVNFETITYDYLIVSTGSHYPSAVKSTNVTMAFRGKMVQQQHSIIEAAQDIVIIGGGVVGVEMAAEIAETYAGAGKRITLVHSRGRLLSRLAVASDGRDGHDMAMEHLEAAGVDVRLSERATHWDEATKSVATSKGDSIKADRVFWCGGPQPLTGFMRAHMPDALDSHGSVKANANLNVEGRKHVFAGGDIVTITGAKTKTVGALVDHIGREDKAGAAADGEDPTGAADGGRKRTLSRAGSAGSMVLRAARSDSGYEAEERMAKNAIDHGLIIARNIRNLVEGKPLEEREVELGVHLMVVSLGMTRGIYVEEGKPSVGDFVAKKDWIEATVMQEVRERRLIIH